MRRPNRTVAIFTLSALDVLAMATGVFVLLVVMLMPYYRMTFDAGAEMEGLRLDVSEMQAEIDNSERAAADALQAAAEADAEAEDMEAAAARLRASAAEVLARASAGNTGQRVATRPTPTPKQAETQVTEQLDLVFVIDASGSMAQVLADLRRSLRGIVRVLERLVPSLRIGFVAYRDFDVGEWVTHDLLLQSTSTHLNLILNFAAGLRPATVGGGTVTEAVYAALERATRMNFRPSAKQTIIVIGDAAAHPNEQAKTLALARSFRDSGPRRTVSALFVTTQAFLRFGRGDRAFFAALARDGGGAFSDHRGELLESVLISVLED